MNSNSISTISYKEFVSGIFSYLIAGIFVFFISSTLFSICIIQSNFFNLKIFLVFSFFIFILQMYLASIITSINSAISLNTCIYAYLGYASLLGVYVSPFFAQFMFEDVICASIISGVTLSIAYYIGQTSKYDLTEIREASKVAMILCISACLLNIFLRIPLLFLAIDIILLFAILGSMVSFAQSFHKIYYTASDSERNRLQIIGAFNILVNFVNILMIILRLFFNRKRD